MSIKNILALLAITFSTSASAGLINTTSAWNGSDVMSLFGKPNSATYGQVVKATGDQLNSFSFLVALSSTLKFKAYVYNWNGKHAVGNALFTSGVATDNGDFFNTVSFLTGGTQVTTGNHYVLFLSISDVFAENPRTFLGDFASVRENTYTDGSFVWQNNGANFGALTTTAWNNWAKADLAFTAHFTDRVNVAEPTTLVLFGFGLIGLVAGRRRVK